MACTFENLAQVYNMWGSQVTAGVIEVVELVTTDAELVPPTVVVEPVTPMQEHALEYRAAGARMGWYMGWNGGMSQRQLLESNSSNRWFQGDRQ